MIKIEKMSAAHLDQVVRIEEECFATPWSRDSFAYECSENKMAHYVVALADEAVVGFAGLWIILDEAQLLNVAVAPAWRGQKIAEMLLRWLLTLAASRGVNSVTLEVRPSNQAALHLYRRLGFEEFSRRKNYYEDNGVYEDALIMWKNLLADLNEAGGAFNQPGLRPDAAAAGLSGGAAVKEAKDEH